MSDTEEVTLSFDPNDLTASEMYWVEDYTGKTLEQMTEDWTIRYAVAFVYILRKRTEPDLTVDIVENMKISEIGAFLGNDQGGATAT